MGAEAVFVVVVVLVKPRPCRGGQENPGEAPISPEGPGGYVNSSFGIGMTDNVIVQRLG